MDRQKAAAFDVDQIRRHYNELSRDLQVEHSKCFEILEVLARDPFNRNIVDINLVLFDEIEQEVQWTFKDLKLHFVFRLH
jgi:hypothetical protein